MFQVNVFFFSYFLLGLCWEREIFSNEFAMGFKIFFLYHRVSNIIFVFSSTPKISLLYVYACILCSKRVVYERPYGNSHLCGCVFKRIHNVEHIVVREYYARPTNDIAHTLHMLLNVYMTHSRIFHTRLHHHVSFNDFGNMFICSSYIWILILDDIIESIWSQLSTHRIFQQQR